MIGGELNHACKEESCEESCKEEGCKEEVT
jgi:hypothetical protein